MKERSGLRVGSNSEKTLPRNWLAAVRVAQGKDRTRTGVVANGIP